MFRFACLAMLCAVTAFAGRTDTYHQDHRSSFLKMHTLSSTSKTVDLEDEDLARHHLSNNAFLYGIDASLAGLELSRIQNSLVGTHYHFAQKLNGIAVHRAEIIVSIAYDSGAVYMVYNNTYPMNGTMKRFAQPVLDEDAALDVAWNHLRVHGRLMDQPKTEMVFLPEGADFRLVYLVELATDKPHGFWEHTIDAELGDILNVRDTAISRNPRDVDAFETYQGQIWDRRDTTMAYEEAQLSREQADFERSMDKAPANGTGQVFDPDPVTALQNSSLSDSSPASAFTGAYVNRTLSDIDLSGGTYRLTGPWVDIIDYDSPTNAPTTTSNGTWNFTRGNQGFNDAMTYFHVDQSQRYMQSLGFTGSTGIQYGAIGVDADGANGADNSYFQPGSNRMSFGHGCVDDNEDAFVILHEYGHAIHHSINNNWSGGDTGGMGEGFGDYWGGSYRYRTANGAGFNPAWAFPWDGHNSCWGGRDMDKTNFQYDPTKSYPAHATVGGVYSDELWSTPLFQALVTLLGQGVTHGEVDQVVLQAHFGLGSGLSMRDMATAIVNTANSLYPSGPHGDVFRQKFEAQNILVPTTGNQAPTAAFSQSASGLTVNFSDGSSDSDGTIASRSWNFGDGNSSTATNPSHSYASAGTYTVSLTVTDNDGATDSTSASVTVSTTPGGGLNNGDTVSNLSGTTGEWRYYTVNMPAGASNFKVVMSGGSGDADLYTRFGAQPTTSSYLCRPYVGGNSETCTVASPQQGVYHIGIRAYSSYSGVSFTVSWDTGGGCTPGNNNQSGLSGSKNSWKHYTINVPACATNLTVTMSGGSGDADLYTRFGAQPTTSSYDCRPYASGNNENCSVSNPQTGTYYVSVRAYSAYSGVNLVISYQ